MLTLDNKKFETRTLKIKNKDVLLIPIEFLQYTTNLYGGHIHTNLSSVVTTTSEIETKYIRGVRVLHFYCTWDQIHTWKDYFLKELITIENKLVV